jgi:SET domain-containing protein
MNHSTTPNLLVNPYDADEMVAARDIKNGEELTADYRTFDSYPESGGKLL